MMSAFWRRLQPAGDLASGMEAELVSDLFDVILRGAFGKDESLGDLAVAKAVGDELGHLSFAPA
jgi:hypothetical protein